MNRNETLAGTARADGVCFLILAFGNGAGFAAIAGGLATGELAWAILGLLALYAVNLPVYIWLSVMVGYCLWEWVLPALSLEVAWLAGSLFYLSLLRKRSPGSAGGELRLQAWGLIRDAILWVDSAAVQSLSSLSFADVGKGGEATA